MIEQLNNTVKFMAFFTASKQGKTGLTDVTIDVFNPAGTKLVNGGACSELGDGIYIYTLASANTSTEGEYIAVFKTADTTVDMQWIPSLWTIGRAGVEHLDSNISDKATQTSVNSIPTNPLLTTDDRLVNLSNLDTPISTRATQTSVNNIPTNTLLSTDTRLDHLDANISSISGGGSPLQATDPRLDNLDSKISLIPVNPVLANDIRLNNLDSAISSRASQESVNNIPKIQGMGNINWNYTLTLEDNVTPIKGATIIITTDVEGTNIVARGITDSYGKVNFFLDAGNIYVWRSKTGYTFSNPDMEVVS